MYHLLPGRKILTTAGFLNVVVLAYLAYWLDPSISSLGVLKYLSVSIFVLDIGILLISFYLWRWIWKYIPVLSEIYFPDLNGIWEGRIIFQSDSGQDGLDARARIKQNLWSIHIDLSSTTSKSHTLVAYPTLESGNQMIYYIYHNTPKNPEYPEYKGTSLLTVKSETSPMQLNGRYFTIRGTRGRIELRRTSLNPNETYEL
jgi:hypothetical protein